MIQLTLNNVQMYVSQVQFAYDTENKLSYAADFKIKI